MAWCHQAPHNYPMKSWPRTYTTYGFNWQSDEGSLLSKFREIIFRVWCWLFYHKGRDIFTYTVWRAEVLGFMSKGVVACALSFVRIRCVLHRCFMFKMTNYCNFIKYWLITFKLQLYWAKILYYISNQTRYSKGPIIACVIYRWYDPMPISDAMRSMSERQLAPGGTQR